ncbi:glycosyltransferase family protein [Novispirillum itersonii subsp. nipponicum]
MLSHVLERCRHIPGIAQVVCAVPDLIEDNPVAQEAERLGFPVTRGPRDDVLARYTLAARQNDATTIMRVTSDCPLIDPEICGQVLAALTGGIDYACNNMPPSFPHGLDVEAMSREWLERAYTEAVAAAHREHVTPYIRTHPDSRKANVDGPGAPFTLWRWTLDYPEDIAFLRALHPYIPTGPEGFGWKTAAERVQQHPELLTINAMHHR